MDDKVISVKTGGEFTPANKNKRAYLVTTEDPSNKSGIRYYLCFRKDDYNSYANLEGLEITFKTAEELNKSEVSTILTQYKDSKTENFIFPWTRIINIKTLK